MLSMYTPYVWENGGIAPLHTLSMRVMLAAKYSIQK